MVAGTGLVVGAGSVVASGLTTESAGSTVAGVSATAVSTSDCVVLSFSTFGFASTGVDAIVVMPALAFSGS